MRMAARKPRSLSPVRRTTPSLEGVEAPHREAATVSEQKINQYRKRRYQALHSDTEAANKRRAAGKATARDRVEMLVDEGSFVELDVFATHRAHGFGMEDRKIAGDGVVAGFGEIDGRSVAIYADDATVFGGSLGEVTAEKIVKVQELALRNRVPIIGINDSGGARIQEGAVALAGYADIFLRNVRSSGVIRQISVIAGPCTGGALYSPAITDFICIGAGQGYMCITGPEVIRGVTAEAATAAAQCGGDMPIISFVDVPGYLPGRDQEHGGIIRHGAKLLYAYAEATVPKLTVITRKDYGGAYCVMSPKQMGADLNLAWPTAEIAVMGPEAAVNIIYKRDLVTAPDPASRRKELVAEYTARFANPYVAAERGYIDDVIEPSQTRRELVRGLQLCLRKTIERPPRKHGNIPL